MPDGMRRLVRDLRRAPLALGDGVKRPLPCEESAIRKMGKKLVAARDLPAGHVLAAGRPRRQVAADGGLPPYELERLLGRRLRRALAFEENVDARGSRARRGASRGARQRRRALSDLDPLLQAVRLAVFDFDGVFTDNRVWVNERGEETVRCCRADGFGLRGCARSASTR